MATTRNSQFRERDSEGRFADNREQRNFGSQNDHPTDYRNHENYTDNNEDEEYNRPFGRSAYYNDNDDGYNDNQNDNYRYSRDTYTDGRERGNLSYHNDYDNYETENANRRNNWNISQENGGFIYGGYNNGSGSHRGSNNNGYQPYGNNELDFFRNSSNNNSYRNSTNNGYSPYNNIQTVEIMIPTIVHAVIPAEDLLVMTNNN